MPNQQLYDNRFSDTVTKAAGTDDSEDNRVMALFFETLAEFELRIMARRFNTANAEEIFDAIKKTNSSETDTERYHRLRRNNTLNQLHRKSPKRTITDPTPYDMLNELGSLLKDRKKLIDGKIDGKDQDSLVQAFKAGMNEITQQRKVIEGALKQEKAKPFLNSDPMTSVDEIKAQIANTSQRLTSLAHYNRRLACLYPTGKKHDQLISNADGYMKAAEELTVYLSPERIAKNKSSIKFLLQDLRPRVSGVLTTILSDPRTTPFNEMNHLKRIFSQLNSQFKSSAKKVSWHLSTTNPAQNKQPRQPQATTTEQRSNNAETSGRHENNPENIYERLPANRVTNIVYERLPADEEPTPPQPSSTANLTAALKTPPKPPQRPAAPSKTTESHTPSSSEASQATKQHAHSTFFDKKQIDRSTPAHPLESELEKEMAKRRKSLEGGADDKDDDKDWRP